MATGQRRGKLNRTITCTTNDRSSPSVGLECEADVLTALKCEPESVNLGQIKRSAARIEQTVKITRGSGGPIKPKLLQTGNPQITADLREIEPGESYELAIVAEPPWPNGMLRGSVQFETGVEQAPNESLMVFGNITPRAQISPQRFTLRPETPSDMKLVARLNWDDNNPGKITEATVNDPALTARVEEQADQQVIVLEVPAGYAPKGRATQVTVKTDDPAVPSLQIPVFAATAMPTSGPAAQVIGPDVQRAQPGMLSPRARATPAAPAQPPTTTAPAQPK
jgi:hypothetical protein